ncbi:(R)-stereoselective amidase [Sedimentisphaera cyanobacteriorum]|uniref:(R)-stereoselective amidase n=1 Tax=Sedimentisphaera cyanobacteriorum TaxID=1940790 RepID=A0A1Q2HRR7_9BACT|nr:carbon-nitrogen hydrolase family protein [Sedimentisphaera cyanobacteriorum]AQQ10147.1 (R)-stereoselective amidase [Sedimentisphaera cyanobacteriorum]
MARVITAATCQFPVSADISANLEWMVSFIRKAGEKSCDVVHFPECCLSGYASVDFKTWKNFDWALLSEAAEKVSKAAEENEIYVIYGTSRQNETGEKPFNSLVVIDKAGCTLSVYDKCFCTPKGIQFYQPGTEYVKYEINGVVCSSLVCYDLRFPEVYRKLKSMGVECIFQSFYNARQRKASVHTDIMRQTMQCRAATNYFWVSMTNSSAPISPYPSAFIRPDGKIEAQLQFDKPGMMINKIDTSQQYYDASGPFRQIAMNGRLNNA